MCKFFPRLRTLRNEFQLNCSIGIFTATHVLPRGVRVAKVRCWLIVPSMRIIPLGAERTLSYSLSKATVNLAVKKRNVRYLGQCLSTQLICPTCTERSLVDQDCCNKQATAKKKRNKQRKRVNCDLTSVLCRNLNAFVFDSNTK